MWMAGVRQPDTPTVPPPPIGQSELFQPCSADPTYRLAVSWKTEKESDEFCNTFYLVQAACGLCSDQSRLSTASDSCMRCSEAMSQINAGKLKVFGYGLLVWLHLFIFRILFSLILYSCSLAEADAKCSEGMQHEPGLCAHEDGSSRQFLGHM